ncbi:hypothetical protein ONZ51_g3485 [Trametes cubensis]|uniref:RNase III domain-containing protein n=1 Tax=Trametes cubensis TaxID=1111947 RepID=A0AAD7TY67_9APHY|nr:hypothetical protein ONZ51_g3485 [Trametes cubensis]
MFKSRGCAQALRRAATIRQTVPTPLANFREAAARLPCRSYSQAVERTAQASRTAPVITPSKSRAEWQKQDAVLVQHLNDVFSPLKFPPELASRILTHASHPDAMRRHNGRLSFVGRRVLQSYLLMFIHSSPALRPEHDYELILERALNTYVLGEHVAPKWQIGKVLKWRPMNVGNMSKPLGPNVEVPSPLMNLEPDNARSVGMYKVHGTTVEALVGGVFHQFGGSVAHRLFHTRVLPHLLLQGSHEGLHVAYHDHAREVCEKMGGPQGPLLR